jgi:predicted GNAT family acetyltransferase
MTTTVRDNSDEHRFEIHVDDALAGFADYQLHEGRITFTHTEVDDAYEGQGLGTQLADAALDSARDAGQQVLPECSFIADHIRRHPDRYLVLVPEGARGTYDL